MRGDYGTVLGTKFRVYFVVVVTPLETTPKRPTGRQLSFLFGGLFLVLMLNFVSYEVLRILQQPFPHLALTCVVMRF